MTKGKTAMKDQLVKFLPLLLTVVTLTISAVLWATGAHADIRVWTADQDYATKTELKEVFKDKYASQTEFAVLREKLSIHEKQHEILIRTLENMDRKIDKLSSRRNRNDGN